jgi:hypothetical protein
MADASKIIGEQLVEDVKALDEASRKHIFHLHALYAEACDRRHNFRADMQRKYGGGLAWTVYLNRGETKAWEALGRVQSNHMDRFFEYIKVALPHRDYESGLGLGTLWGLKFPQ